MDNLRGWIKPHLASFSTKEQIVIKTKTDFTINPIFIFNKFKVWENLFT